MKLYTVKTPKVIQQIYASYLWRFSISEKCIYLTFDDGPTPEVTDFVLTELKRFNAKATFFCIGNNIKKHPDIFQRVIDNGHSIGNHTHNHLKGWKTKTKNYIEDALEAEKSIYSMINSNSIKLFRPPYGKLKKKQAKRLQGLGYKIVMWDVVSADFDVDISNSQCLENVIHNTTNGSIVVFHDSFKARERMEYALPKVLRYFTEKGFEFRSIAELSQ